ncbi:MAG: hypothetical protein QM765_43560 [Myxococcales bacterium]
MSPAPSFTIVSEDDFLKAHPIGAPFEVEVDGDQQSFLGKVQCAYWEWIYGVKEGGRLDSYTIAFHSDAPLLLLADGKRTALPFNRVRVYAAPAFEKEFKAGDKTAPEVVQEQIEKAKKPIYVAEYRLQAGKKFHAVVFEDVYRLPPEGPGKPPRQGKRTVLRISDKPFKQDGAPQGEATPGFRHWVY